MEVLALARHAMATRFEIILYGENAIALRSAAEEALDEIDRLEAQLSLYRPSSEISFINRRAASEPVRVEPRLFRLLQQARRLHQESGGAFDITIAPLVRCWGFMGGAGQLPKRKQIAEARARVGMHLVSLDEDSLTIRFACDGVMLDLGAIGKGYALEQAAGILREAGVKSALLHGGTSTVYAIGSPPDEVSWKVAVKAPPTRPKQQSSARKTSGADSPNAKDLLAVVPLKNEALSVSGVHGKAFSVSGKIYGHVIDPRTGYPIQGALLGAVVLPSATETDALSTALLTVGLPGHKQITDLRPGMRTLLVAQNEKTGRWLLDSVGITLSAARPRPRRSFAPHR